MTWFKNISIFKKILFLGLFLFAIDFLLLGLSTRALWTIYTQSENMTQYTLPMTEKVTDAYTHQLQKEMFLEQYVRLTWQAREDNTLAQRLASVNESLEKSRADVKKAFGDAHTFSQNVLTTLTDPVKKPVFEAAAAKVSELQTINLRLDETTGNIITLAKQNKLLEAGQVLNSIRADRLATREKMNSLFVDFEKLNSITTHGVKDIVNNSMVNMATISVITMLMALVVLVLVLRSVAVAEKNLRMLTNCLSNIRNNVMIADNDDRISYMNTASFSSLRALENTIRASYPHFNMDKIIGASIHAMHKNPDRIRNILRGLKEGQLHEGRIALGGLTLQLNVGGIFQNGQRMGSYAEWRDITQQAKEEEAKADLSKRITATAGQVNTASKQISEGNMNLSERTEAQAANVEEATASMQQVTERVQQNAQNAQNALKLASDAREAATKGGDVVKQAIGAMQTITASSSKIADIIGVIDEIAFQTNLLALNAAVEAARAGDQGRGFAVVASEVRALAGRSAKAAKEIKDLITDSVEKIKGGSAQVNETGERLGEIITNVQKVTDVVAEISHASNEQAGNIAEINKSVAQMDSFTQQNAALVEEAAAASKALQDEAMTLLKMVEEMRSTAAA